MPDLEVENLIDVDDKPKKLKSGEICVTFSIYLGIQTFKSRHANI